MYSSTREGTKRTMVGIAVAASSEGTLVSIRKRVSAVLAQAAWLDNKSRSDIMEQAMKVGRVCLLVPKEELAKFVSMNLDEVMKAWNRAYKRTWVRTRKTNVMSGMKLQRGRVDPVVFYLVSSHQKPQPAHEPLQGKLLVDYYWRSVLEGDYRLERVGKIVRNRKIRTVQWALGAPHYLITRPNCRHYLIPVKTNDVLALGIRDIRALYQKKRTGIRRPLTDQMRRKEYLELRRAVLSEASRRLGK